MSIDWWTLGLQTVNVLVLLLLLQHFLYRPLARTVTARRTLALEQERATEQARHDAETARTALEEERRQWEAERQQRLDAVAIEAQQRRELLIAEVEQDARARAVAIAHAQQQALESDRLALQGEAAQLAVEVVRRLLQRLPSAALSGLFLEELCAAVRGLATQTGSTPTSACLRSAGTMDEAGLEHAQAALSEAWGARLTLRHELAPELIAGFELQLPHSLVRSNWAQDLQQIATALAEAVGARRLATTAASAGQDRAAGRDDMSGGRT